MTKNLLIKKKSSKGSKRTSDYLGNALKTVFNGKKDLYISTNEKKYKLSGSKEEDNLAKDNH